MSCQVKTAEFFKGYSNLRGLPPEAVPEIAVIGRSNVGKSSFINRICCRKSLAKTSSTPGRTRELNYFSLYLDSGGSNRKLFLVDLPGFGYAKFSKQKREKISSLIVDFLSQREELAVVALLNDCRRAPERDELALRDLVFNSGKNLLVVLTKIDKIKKNAKPKIIKERALQFGLEPQDVVLSGLKFEPHSFWEKVISLLDAVQT